MNKKNLLLTKKIEKIHQIMIVDGGDLPERLPEAFHVNSVEIRNLHKDIPYQMWSGKSVRELIENNFDKSVLNTYDTLVPYAYKADLARLCVLYVEGGLYVDLGVKLLKEFKLPIEAEFCVFRDLYQETNGFMMQNGLIFSNKGRAELLHAINWTVQNCMNLYYGLNSLYPTGPMQLGRAVALVSATSGPGGSPSQWIGECRAITPSNVNKNMIYTDPFGNLTAVRAKVHAGDLAHMGLKGGNNHNVIWQNRQVYGEKSSVWTYDDLQIQLTGGGKRTPDGITTNNYKLGRFTYGPYIQLKPGNYELKINFKSSSKFSNLFVEVCNRGGADEIFKGWYSNEDDNFTELKVKFYTDRPYQGVEIRLSNEDWFNGFIEKIEITPVQIEEKHFFISGGEMQGKISTETGFLTADGVYSRKENAGNAMVLDLGELSAGFYNAALVFQSDVEFKKVSFSIYNDAKVITSKEFLYKYLPENNTIDIDFSISEDVSCAMLYLTVGKEFEGGIERIIITAGKARSVGKNTLVDMLGITA